MERTDSVTTGDSIQMQPLFSVVIPTRNRADLARKAIAHVLQQSFRDFEVLVMDNSDTAHLSQQDFTDSRVRLLPSNRVLSMPDNWERSLDHARGKYLLVISDKDMLLPDALTSLANVAARGEHDVINYRKSLFSSSQGFVDVHVCSGDTFVCPMRPVLRAWFQSVHHMHDAPMIYNSAVRSDLVMSIRERHGRFFVGTAPDVCSGIVLSASTSHYIHIDRILSLAHFGPWSIGAASMLGCQGPAEKFAQEFGGDPVTSRGLVHGIPGIVAETLLACKRAFPDLMKGHQISWSGYVKETLRELAGRELKGIDVARDQTLLKAGAGKIYPRSSYFIGRMKMGTTKFLAKTGLRSLWMWIRHESILKVVFPPHDRLERMASRVLSQLKSMFTRSQTPSTTTSWHHKRIAFCGVLYTTVRDVETFESAFKLVQE